MPRLWSDTIATHRREIRDAILDAATELVANHGLLSVTMSRIAEETGIARATLYKYFPDVEAILLAWHERQVAAHLRHLGELAAATGDATERLEAVLEAYAFIQHEHAHTGSELGSLLHRRPHVARAQRQLTRFVRDLLAEGSEANAVRKDIPPDELAAYCLHALAAASSAPSRAAVRRLVALALAGLRASAVERSDGA